MTSPTPLTELIKKFGATETEAKFLAKIMSNESIAETLEDIRTLTTQHTKEKEEILKKLDGYIDHRNECIQQFEEDADCDCGLTEILHNITI